MILTERDKIVIRAIVERGRASSRYLARFFPTHQAMLTRLNILRKNGILESERIRDIVKYIDFKSTTIDYSKFLPINSLFFTVSDKVYKELGVSNTILKSKQMITHQIYQEYVELYLLNNFDIKNMQANPSLKPQPDLYFNYNSKNISIEIERTIKKNPNDTIQRRKKKDGSVRESIRRGFSYDKHMDKLLNFSDVIIYFFDNDKTLEKFLKNTYTKRLYCTTFSKPDELINSKGEKLPTGDVLNY